MPRGIRNQPITEFVDFNNFPTLRIYIIQSKNLTVVASVGDRDGSRKHGAQKIKTPKLAQ